jgi:hypothetical protein
MLFYYGTNIDEVKSGSVVELANVSIAHPRDLGSNHGSDTKILIVFVSHLNPNLLGVNS